MFCGYYFAILFLFLTLVKRFRDQTASADAIPDLSDTCCSNKLGVNIKEPGRRHLAIHIKKEALPRQSLSSVMQFNERPVESLTL